MLDLNQQSSKKKIKAISIDEKFYLEKILKKYGTDFEKAVVDDKVNKFYWTANQMAKKYNSYLHHY